MLNQLQMVAWRAKTNKSLESQNSNCSLRIMTKGKWMTNIKLAQDNSRKCQNVHRAMETESLIIWWQSSVLQYPKDNLVYLKTSNIHNSSVLPSDGRGSPPIMVPVTFHTFTFGLPLPPPPVWQLVLTCQIRERSGERQAHKNHTGIISNSSLQLHRS